MMLPFLILLLPAFTNGFVVLPEGVVRGFAFQGSRSPMAIDSFNKEYGLFMSSDKDGTTSLPKRRRKRKEKVEEDSSETPTMKEVIEAEPEPKLDLKPRDNLPVEMQVRDIREIVGGVVPSEPSTTAPNLETAPTLTGSSVASTAESSTAGTSSASNDAFELLLEDARRMKADAGDVEIESDDSIKAKVRNVLSTIVTADFFIVFGFLLWFLAGIAYRAAFDDASVQIAFNNNFEVLVQPALGVLMVGTIAGNFLKDEDDDY